MHRILQYLRPWAARISLGLTIKFIGTIMDLLLPWILSYLVDTVVPRKEIPPIFFWGVMMLICSVIAVVGNIVANRMAARVAQRTTERVRHDLFERISYLSSRQIDRFTIPSLESRLTTDTYNVHQMVSMMQRLGIRAPILLLGGILVTLTLEPVLTLVLLIMLPFIGVVVFWVSKRGIPLYTNLQQGVDAMVRTVRENISGIRVVKALSKVEFEKGRFSEVNSEVVRREKKAGITMALTNPLMSLFLNVGLTLVILVGAYRVNGGLTQPGKIIAFLSYFTIILNAMLSITRMFVMLSKGSASAARIQEVLDTPQDLEVQPSEAAAESSPAHVEFDHVSFSYLGKGNNLENISFCLRPGETLGILGATGSGKSTVINLLMRMYDADQGQIRIFGRDVRSIPAEELHTKFGVVFQNDILFSDTIAGNIDFGRNLPPEEIERAARAAQAMEFISELPDGLEHRLTPKGTNLSGGQKQRLLVARALAGTPEILILDDSSSALDYRTDSMLRRALAQEYGAVTKVIIAQRVSSLRHADHILVLEEGRELGYGTHEELMRSCPVYREISEAQMGLEEV